jgi:hypothetical protein
VAWDVDQTGTKNLVIANVAAGASSAKPMVVPGTTGTTYPQLARLRDGTVAVAWTQLTGDSLKISLASIGGAR